MKSTLKDLLYRRAQAIAPLLCEIRRSIHRCPELGFKEINTAKIISKELDNLGIVYDSAIGGTGIVGIIEGSKSGKTVAIRADMDAVPVIEKSGLDYSSDNYGVMHACGHDAHVAILLGTAVLLKDFSDRFSGQVKLIFQPAEEIDQGALSIISDGGIDHPKPERIYGIHVDPAIPVGKFRIAAGPVMAGIDSFRIQVLGKGGHGANPHLCVDPILVGSSIVQNLQSIVSRNIDPISPAVVSIGTFFSGTANNVIPDVSELTGTVRFINPAISSQIHLALKRICRSTANSFGAKVCIHYKKMVPPLINDERSVRILRKSIECLAGVNSILDAPQRMGGDDFAFYLQNIPGAFFHIGSSGPDNVAGEPLHSGRFNLDEACIPLGAAVLAMAAIRSLAEFS